MGKGARAGSPEAQQTSCRLCPSQPLPLPSLCLWGPCEHSPLFLSLCPHTRFSGGQSPRRQQLPWADHTPSRTAAMGAQLRSAYQQPMGAQPRSQPWLSPTTTTHDKVYMRDTATMME